MNNALIQRTSPVEESPDEHCDAVIPTNLSSNFAAVKDVLPQMRAQLGVDCQYGIGAPAGRVDDQVGVRRRETYVDLFPSEGGNDD